VFFVSPTLTMMHLCIIQCTYWTPLTGPHQSIHSARGNLICFPVSHVAKAYTQTGWGRGRICPWIRKCAWIEWLGTIIATVLYHSTNAGISRDYSPIRRTTSFNQTSIISFHFSLLTYLGVVHKVRHARGGGGPIRCDSLWQGGVGVQEHVTSHFLKKFHTYET